jgi:hypothetical protein
MPWDVTEDYIRSGHRDPARYDPDSFRIISISAKEGIRAVIACPKGKFREGQCRNGTEVQSYLFMRSKGWTLEKAKAWYQDHKKEEAPFDLPPDVRTTYIEERMKKGFEQFAEEMKRALQEMDGRWYERPGQRIEPKKRGETH